MSRVSRLLAAALFATVTVSSAGCFGRFALTRKIWTFNKGISGNQFVNSIVMWGMLIIPVYELGSFVDLIIINPIELLTGNPLVMRDDGQGGARAARFGHEWSVRPVNDTTLAVLRDGQPYGTARMQADGTVALEDITGKHVTTLAARPELSPVINDGSPAAAFGTARANDGAQRTASHSLTE